MIIIGNFIPNIFGIFMRIKGITLGPFIFLRPTATEVDINHEKIHVRQMWELLVVLFYVWYILNYVYNFFKYFYEPHRVKYKNIIFEKEAYTQQDNLEYLRTRKFWNFLKY